MFFKVCLEIQLMRPKTKQSDPRQVFEKALDLPNKNLKIVPIDIEISISFKTRGPVSDLNLFIIDVNTAPIFPEREGLILDILNLPGFHLPPNLSTEMKRVLGAKR